MIERLRGLDVHVELADVREQAKGSISLGRPHLARALVHRGYVETVQQAFDEYLQDEGSGFVALRRLTSKQIVGLTHESGGISVIAHPMRLRQPEHLDELLGAGIDGVEIVHPTAEPQDERRLRAFAREHGLLVTGGTDFHAPVEGRPIGIEFDDEDAARLLERLAAAPAERPH
jgi:predicted metal-dependent phosphoesterase TrpH